MATTAPLSNSDGDEHDTGARKVPTANNTSAITKALSSAAVIESQSCKAVKTARQRAREREAFGKPCDRILETLRKPWFVTNDYRKEKFVSVEKLPVEIPSNH